MNTKKLNLVFSCVIWGLMLSFLDVPEVRAQLVHGDPIVIIIGTDAVNVRSAPEISESTLIRKISRGTQMKRLGKRGNWYEVLLPNGQTAWVSSRYAQESTARDLLEITASVANIRRSPSTAASRVGTVDKGGLVSLVEERNNWYRVILRDGTRGWIHQDLVVRRPLSPPEPKTAEQPDVPDEKPEVKTPEKAAPQKPVDYYKEAKALVAEGRSEEAIEVYQKALETRPEDGAINFDLARLLKSQGQPDAALVYFRKALRAGNRPEAKFHIDEILNAAEAGIEPVEEILPDSEESEDEAWEELLQASAAYLLPGLASGSLIFMIVLGFVFYRRRRASRLVKPAYRRRKQDGGFDAVLTYAVEKRPLLRAIEEAERKRLDMDEALQQRFEVFGKEIQKDGPRLPSGETSESLLKKVDELRQTILNQEERAQIYADLVVLQNEKLEALDEEIEALKKLIQIDYKDAPKESGSPKKAREGTSG